MTWTPTPPGSAKSVDALLALLPTNLIGDIEADEMRDIISELASRDSAIEAKADTNATSITGLASGMTLKGTVVNAAALPVTAADGDAYVTEDDGTIHMFHTATGWTQLHSTIEPRLFLVEHVASALNDRMNIAEKKINEGETGAVLPNIPMTVAVLRALDVGVAYPLPKIGFPTDPSNPASLHLFSDGPAVGLSPDEWIEDAYLIRVSPLQTLLYARRYTGTPNIETVLYTMTVETATAGTVTVGVTGAAAFRSDLESLRKAIGPAEAFGHDVSHEILLVQSRLSALEHVSPHAPPMIVAAPAERIDARKNPSGFIEFVIPDAAYDGTEHTFLPVWGGGVKPSLAGAIPYTFTKDAGGTHASNPLVTLAGDPVPITTTDMWIKNGTRIVVKFDASIGLSGGMVYLRAAHQAALPPGVHPPSILPSAQMTVGDLRDLDIGKTYLMPTVNKETVPGSGTTVEVANLDYVNVRHRGQEIVNAVMIREGAETWKIIGSEWTGTDSAPIAQWFAEIDPAWPDSTAVGTIAAVSFSSQVWELWHAIGDASVFGADTIVTKMQALELALDAASRRIATLETAGGGTHGHTDVAADMVLFVNSQGPHFVMVLDDPSMPDHIGIDLVDGGDHKIALKWGAGFDPTHFDDGTGTFIDWDATPGTVWFQSGAIIKRIVDPATGALISYAAVKAFIDGGSVLTVKWNAVALQLEILAIEHGSVHP